MHNIVQDGDPVLRTVSEAVPLKDIGSNKIKKIIKRMKDALEKADDGVAIAAPQIGIPLRIFVVSHRAEEIVHENDPKFKSKNEVFINPEIVELGEEIAETEEGCLSVSGIYGTVKRYTRAVVEAYNEKGKKITKEGHGLIAQIYQHETDHLNGRLFVDHAKDLYRYNHNENKTRLAFFGSDEFSIIVLETLKTRGIMPHLIITTPMAVSGRGLTQKNTLVFDWAEENKIKVITPESLKNNFKDEYSQEMIDIALVASYGKILPEEILNIPKAGTFNIHPSLLPRWRGASPIESAILNDDFTGVTLMKMDAKMDHGPIVTQERVDFENWPCDKKIILTTLGERGAEMFLDNIPNILGGKITLQTQDESAVTFCTKVSKNDGEVDIDSDPQIIIRKLFAYQDWPTTFFFTERNNKKIRVIIEKAHIKDGVLILDQVKPEGKKSMPYKDFLAGSKSHSKK